MAKSKDGKPTIKSRIGETWKRLNTPPPPMTEQGWRLNREFGKGIAVTALMIGGAFGVDAAQEYTSVSDKDLGDAIACLETDECSKKDVRTISKMESATNQFENGATSLGFGLVTAGLLAATRKRKFPPAAKPAPDKPSGPSPDAPSA